MEFLEQVGLAVKQILKKWSMFLCVSHIFGTVYQYMAKDIFCPSKQLLTLWEDNENTLEHEWGSIYHHQIFVAVFTGGMSEYRLGTVLDNHRWD